LPSPREKGRRRQGNHNGRVRQEQVGHIGKTGEKSEGARILERKHPLQQPGRKIRFGIKDTKYPDMMRERAKIKEKRRSPKEGV